MERRPASRGWARVRSGVGTTQRAALAGIRPAPAPLCLAPRSPAPRAALGERASERGGRGGGGRWGWGRGRGGGRRREGGSGKLWGYLTAAREAARTRRSARCGSAAAGARPPEQWGRYRPSPRAARPPAPAATMLPPQLCWLPLLAGLLPPAPAQKFSALTVSPAAAAAAPPASAPGRGSRWPRRRWGQLHRRGRAGEARAGQPPLRRLRGPGSGRGGGARSGVLSPRPRTARSPAWGASFRRLGALLPAPGLPALGVCATRTRWPLAG